MSKRIPWITAAIALSTLAVLTLLRWDELLTSFHFARLRSGTSTIADLISRPGAVPRRALERYVDTQQGQLAFAEHLFRTLVDIINDQDGTAYPDQLETGTLTAVVALEPRGRDGYGDEYWVEPYGMPMTGRTSMHIERTPLLSASLALVRRLPESGRYRVGPDVVFEIDIGDLEVMCAISRNVWPQQKDAPDPLRDPVRNRP